MPRPLWQKGQSQAINFFADANPQIVGDTHSFFKSRIHRLAVGRILATFQTSPAGTLRQQRLDKAAAQKFAEALLHGKVAAAAAMPRFGSDAILSRLIPDTAKRLGSMWDEDECCFFDVTLALQQLCGLVREITIQERRGDCSFSNSRSVLLTSIANNHHTLGLLLVEAAFIRSGWNVLSLQARDDILGALRSTWFAAVGLSIACACDADKVAELIVAFRNASLNSSIVVLVGGAYFTADPEAAVRVGADANADDASHAVAACGRLIEDRR